MPEILIGIFVIVGIAIAAVCYTITYFGWYLKVSVLKPRTIRIAEYVGLLVSVLTGSMVGKLFAILAAAS